MTGTLFKMVDGPCVADTIAEHCVNTGLSKHSQLSKPKYLQLVNTFVLYSLYVSYLCPMLLTVASDKGTLCQHLSHLSKQSLNCFHYCIADMFVRKPELLVEFF